MNNKEAKFYKRKEGDIVQCSLCSHFCVIENSKTGKCRVRKNNKGRLETLVYGFPVSTNIDPIEKKPFFHFQPDSLTYSLGTLGCNFSCLNCQNYNISQAQASEIEKAVRAGHFVSPERIIEDAIGNDCRSVAYTYNEPTIFSEYALDIMKLAKGNGLMNVWVSNGFMTDDCLDAILPYLDAINIDLKSMDDGFYRDACSARLDPVLENLKRAKKEQVHLEITTLIIPQHSDDIENLERIADFIVTELDSETPWHLSKFSPEISWKMKQLDETPDDVIYEAYEIGKSAGLKYVYVGNIPGDQKENTYCPRCGELAIRRMGYHIERLDSSGRCAYCDKSLDIMD